MPGRARGLLGRGERAARRPSGREDGSKLEKRSHVGSSLPRSTCSVAKARWKVTDADMLRWLFSGPPEERDASGARKKELAKAHKQVFRDMYGHL